MKLDILAEFDNNWRFTRGGLVVLVAMVQVTFPGSHGKHHPGIHCRYGTYFIMGCVVMVVPSMVFMVCMVLHRAHGSHGTYHPGYSW